MTSRGKQLLQLALKSVEKTIEASSQETEVAENVSESGKL